MLNITFTGNVGNDPVLRQVNVGDEVVSVANFSVAVNNPQNNDLPPTWIRVSVWRKYAEIVAQYVRKGHRVSVSAESIKATAWTDAEGELRAGIEVTARRVDFSGNRRSEDDDPAPAQGQVGKQRQQPAHQSAKPQAQPTKQKRPARRSSPTNYDYDDGVPF